MMSLPPNSQTISLPNLKQRIAAVDRRACGWRRLTEAYRECVVKKYEHMRLERNWPILMGKELTLWNLAPAIGSAYLRGQRSTGATSATSTPIPPRRGWKARTQPCSASSPGPRRRPAIEQAEIISTARPLPAGEYSFDIKERESVFKPCNYVVSNEVTVTVTARGALHEFFFDPVTLGTPVAANSTNGVLSPASLHRRQRRYDDNQQPGVGTLVHELRAYSPVRTGDRSAR